MVPVITMTWRVSTRELLSFLAFWNLMERIYVESCTPRSRTNVYILNTRPSAFSIYTIQAFSRRATSSHIINQEVCYWSKSSNPWSRYCYRWLLWVERSGLESCLGKDFTNLYHDKIFAFGFPTTLTIERDVVSNGYTPALIWYSLGNYIWRGLVIEVTEWNLSSTSKC